MDIGTLILGWLFGLLSPGIVNGIARGYKKNDVEKAIFADLEELRIKMVFISFTFRMRNREANV